jgi:hypothetical protein
MGVCVVHACECVCVLHAHKHSHTPTLIFLRVCMCLCVVARLGGLDDWCGEADESDMFANAVAREGESAPRRKVCRAICTFDP